MTTEKRARQKANRATRVAEAEAAAARARTRSRLMIYGGLALLVVLVIVGVSLLTADDDEPTASTGDDTGQSGDDTGQSGDEPAGATTAPPPPTEPPSDSIPGADECPAEDGSSPRVIDFAGPLPTCTDPTASYTAVFDTSEGEIRVALDTENTPNTVNNFVTLARWGYYDGTTIFRTDPSIDIIQGGSPHTNSASDPGPGYTIPDEPTFEVDEATGQLTGPYTYEPGQLVMARSQGPDASGAQFFFVAGEQASLLDAQGTYIVFGTTDEAGIGVLETIIGLHQDDPTSGLGGAPSRTVMIESVTIVEE